MPKQKRRRPEPAPAYPRTRVALSFPKISVAECYNAETLLKTSRKKPAPGGAVDIHLDATDPPRKALGDALFGSLRRKATALEIESIVWNGEVWSRVQGGPRPYPGEHPHSDRLHVEFKRPNNKQTMLIEIEVDLAMMRAGRDE